MPEETQQVPTPSAQPAASPAAPATATPNEQKPAAMQSTVQYHAGRTNFAKAGYGLLEWTAEGHIRLFEVDPKAQKTTNLLFDLIPSQITKVTTSISILNFNFDNQVYSLDFTKSAFPWLAAGGTLGLGMAYKAKGNSGVDWWVDNLKNQGVQITDYNLNGKAGKKILIWSLVGVFVLVILFAIAGAGS